MTYGRRALACASALAALLIVAPAQAAPFQVTIDTTPLSGQNAALGFDFLNGGDPPTNSVTISGFSHTGGTLGNAYLTTDATIAGATALSTPAESVVLSDSGGAFFLEFLQYLTLGSSFTFTFDPSSAPGDSTPDTFLFYILVGTEPPPEPPDLLPLLVYAPTNPDGTGALVRFEIGVTDPTQPLYYQGETIPASDTEQPQAIGVKVAAVPAPGTLALAIAGLLALGGARVRRGGPRRTIAPA